MNAPKKDQKPINIHSGKADMSFLNKSLKNQKGEKWREIPDTEGCYLISNFGRVKALSRYIERGKPLSRQWIKEKILNQAISKQKNQYKNDCTFGLMVRYQYNKQRFAPMVRRLVYEAFVQPKTRESMEGKYVYSKDGNPFNNYASNLGLASKSELRKAEFKRDRYCYPISNLDPDVNRKRLDKIRKANKRKRRKVKQYRLNGALIKTFPSITAASGKTGISIACISLCAYKKLPQTRGSVWRFEKGSYNGYLVRQKKTG